AIEFVVVERMLPRTLSIKVTEREPVAQFSFPNAKHGGGRGPGIFTIDANGYFMFPIEPSQRSTPSAQTNDHLPLIVGVPARDVRPGRKTESSQVRLGLDLLRALERSSMASVVDVKQVDVTIPGVVVVTTAQGN